jgi:class 3 adenylate cyclase
MEAWADRERGLTDVAQIVVLSGACEGTTFVLPDIPTVVGRSPESHLQIADPWISSMHAMFERRGTEIWVVDLDSRNGTFIGDARISEARVPDGALVRFGHTEVRVDLHRAPPGLELVPQARPSDPQRETARTDGPPHVARGPTSHVPLAAEDDPYLLAPRSATVLRMSVDAVGIDTLTDAPDRLRGALDAAVRAARDAGGVVARLGGVGVLAVFGLLDPAPDDAARALGAARVARRAVRARGGLDLRAALDTGVVLAGNSAGEAGFELAVLGPAAERVERMLAAAGLGEILGGPAVAAATGLPRAGIRVIGGERLEVFRAEGP